MWWDDILNFLVPTIKDALSKELPQVVYADQMPASGKEYPTVFMQLDEPPLGNGYTGPSLEGRLMFKLTVVTCPGALSAQLETVCMIRQILQKVSLQIKGYKLCIQDEKMDLKTTTKGEWAHFCFSIFMRAV